MHVRDQKFPGLCIKFTIFMSFSMARFYFLMLYKSGVGAKYFMKLVWRNHNFVLFYSPPKLYCTGLHTGDSPTLSGCC